MKKIILAASLILTAASFTGYTANATIAVSKGGGKHIPASQVPPAVLASFQSNFPSAANVRWEKEREHGAVVYQADFYLNGKRWRAEFATDGTIISSGRH